MTKWREKTQINKIKDEKGDITTNANKIQVIIRQYFENLYLTKKFLDSYNQPKLNQEDIKHHNGPIISNEIEAIVKSLLTKKIPVPDAFSDEFYQTFKELTRILFKNFQEIEREWAIQKSFY
jgi:hypothetical protein